MPFSLEEISMTAWGCRDTASIILKEHQQLTTVIGGMLQFVRLREKGAATPSFVVFRSMLYYIREYPERVHHPKEERDLFTRIRARTHEIDDVLDDLNHQHTEGEAMVRDLEHALTRYELAGDPALPDFASLVEKYASFYANHRRIEEEIVIPVALRVLTRDDWTEIDAAFGANRDPFEGVELEEDLDKLFRMIVNTIP
jgi:hemerythrin-like domain-containing protein